MVMGDKDVVLTPLLPAKLLVAEQPAQPFLNYLQGSTTLYEQLFFMCQRKYLKNLLMQTPYSD